MKHLDRRTSFKEKEERFVRITFTKVVAKDKLSELDSDLPFFINWTRGGKHEVHSSESFQKDQFKKGEVKLSKVVDAKCTFFYNGPAGIFQEKASKFVLMS